MNSRLIASDHRPGRISLDEPGPPAAVEGLDTVLVIVGAEGRVRPRPAEHPLIGLDRPDLIDGEEAIRLEADASLGAILWLPIESDEAVAPLRQPVEVGGLCVVVLARERYVPQNTETFAE